MNQKIVFACDHYFGHTNIIRLSERPLALVEETDLELIKRRNEKASFGDIVYHPGDICQAKHQCF